MKYPPHLKSKVANRGAPPDAFLDEFIQWIKCAPEEIFAPNNDPEDVFLRLAPLLGPWKSPAHRRAALGVAMIKLGGLEASWKWNEGVDITNRTSMANIRGQETGIFQVSFDSLDLDDIKGTGDDLHQCVMKYCGALDVHIFIDRMKSNHPFALEYGARLLRNNFYWDGPIKRRELDKWLSNEAVDELIALIS